jgi:hypothetical protein
MVSKVLVLLLLHLTHVILGHECLYLARALGNTWGVTALPLKGISSRDLGRDPLEGYQEGVMVRCNFQVSLFNCSSNVILFATSEGSPSRFISTTYFTLNN